MNDIAFNLNKIKSSLKPGVELIAVSKTKPIEDIKLAYEAGQRHFGENKIQEMQSKYQQLPKDIVWHMIGHVQTNKVKYMADFVALIHGVESIKLLQEINKRAEQNNRIIDCLLQVYIAQEESKFGFDQAELEEILEGDIISNFKNIRIRGLMGMASFTENYQQISKEFAGLKSLFDKYSSRLNNFDILSMGMSGDYQIAIENGSNMVRIGSSIFGSRNYNN